MSVQVQDSFYRWVLVSTVSNVSIVNREQKYSVKTKTYRYFSGIYFFIPPFTFLNRGLPSYLLVYLFNFLFTFLSTRLPCYYRVYFVTRSFTLLFSHLPSYSDIYLVKLCGTGGRRPWAGLAFTLLTARFLWLLWPHLPSYSAVYLVKLCRVEGEGHGLGPRLPC